MSEPTVHLDRVTKRFGDFTAVRELDLKVGRGEFFTLLATMIFVATLVLMGFTVWQQRRAERMASVRPEEA